MRSTRNSRLALALLALSLMAPASANAQLVVVRTSSSASALYPVGTVIYPARVLRLSRGQSLTLVSQRTGRTYRVNGPGTGTVAAMVGRQWARDENRPAVRQGAVR
jgi:hypothetical protein